MTDTAKPTAGPCFVDEFCDVDKGYALIAYRPDVGKRSPTRGMVAWFGTIAGATFRKPEQCKANAELAAEAFNIHTETGLTPRQLVEQRDGLLDLAKLLRVAYHAAVRGCSSAGLVYESANANSIIAKAEAKP